MTSPTHLWPGESSELERIVSGVRERHAQRASLSSTGDESNYRTWLKTVSPSFNWDWPYMVALTDALDRIARGELKYLIIEMPPRHGKTEATTVRFPVYLLERDPTTRIILGAYNQTTVEKFSRKARRIARDRLSLSEERSSAGEWETEQGGSMFAVGVGSGVTGSGGNGIIIDDPVKSREEAESDAYSERVWDWYTDDIYSRREPGCFMVVIMTRWRENDLVGRILASEHGAQWEVLRFPALAEDNDPLGRAPGEPLCPDRYDVAALKEIETVQGSYGFSALYQQRPTPRAGNMFPRGKVGFCDVPPLGPVVRYWDKAGTPGGGARTAGVAILRGPDKKFYVCDSRVGQWGAYDRKREMINTTELDSRRWHNYRVRVEQEPGSGGLESAQADVKMLAGFRVAYDRPIGNKEFRADPWSAQWQAGNVVLVRGDWNESYLREHETFPNGKYKDQVDASDGAFATLTRFPPNDTDPTHYAKSQR